MRYNFCNILTLKNCLYNCTEQDLFQNTTFPVEWKRTELPQLCSAFVPSSCSDGEKRSWFRYCEVLFLNHHRRSKRVSCCCSPRRRWLQESTADSPDMRGLCCACTEGITDTSWMALSGPAELWESDWLSLHIWCGYKHLRTSPDTNSSSIFINKAVESNGFHFPRWYTLPHDYKRD